MSDPADEERWPQGGSGALIAYAAALRSALVRYERNRSGAELDGAFAAAAAAMASARGERAGEPPDTDELESLFELLPDFERLVTVAAEEAERSARAAGAGLWRWFGASSAPPRWTEAERARARLLVACACAPVDGQGASWLRPRLLKLAADRWAALIVHELREADEEVWRRALGERYESVRQRCAPRTKLRTRELAVLLASDPRAGEMLRKRLSDWLAAGADLDRLAAEIEAALVQSRTPARIA